MARWEKRDIRRDEDYPVEPEIVDAPVIKAEAVPVVKTDDGLIVLKVGDKVGDIVIKHIYGKHQAFYNPQTQRLVLTNGVSLDAYHKDIKEDVFLSFGGGTPKVVGFDKAAFKAGRYELI